MTATAPVPNYRLDKPAKPAEPTVKPAAEREPVDPDDLEPDEKVAAVGRKPWEKRLADKDSWHSKTREWAAKLKALRAQTNLKQVEISRLLHAKEPTYGMWERGTFSPKGKKQDAQRADILRKVQKIVADWKEKHAAALAEAGIPQDLQRLVDNAEHAAKPTMEALVKAVLPKAPVSPASKTAASAAPKRFIQPPKPPAPLSIVVCGGKKQWIASAVGDDPTIQFDTIMAAYETEHSPDGGVVGNN